MISDRQKTISVDLIFHWMEYLWSNKQKLHRQWNFDDRSALSILTSMMNVKHPRETVKSQKKINVFAVLVFISDRPHHIVDSSD